MSRSIKLGGQAVAVAVVVALFVVLVWRLTHRTAPPKPGAAAPAFSLNRLDGSGPISLASLRGRTVVLNFWASWCGPCKREAPALETIWKDYRAKNVVVLGVDSGDEKSDARRFLAAHGVTYPIVSDPNEILSGNTYNVPGLPATFVIDAQGRLVGKVVLGPISDKPYAVTFHSNLAAAMRS
ncbi:MAG TPA: TlpA disulfide reductase family protein [Gaiellaceae bacterium]|nr:TlpA disulfide reductase family protein [Gaiellaceae bacterium]